MGLFENETNTLADRIHAYSASLFSDFCGHITDQHKRDQHRDK